MPQHPQPARDRLPDSPIEPKDNESIPRARPVVAASRRRALIVGALTVAAIWILATGGPFNRAETPVVPGGAETGPAVAEPTVPPHVSWDGFVGLSPEGAKPSTPETGKLIAQFQRQFGSVFVYADGRVIWSHPESLGSIDLFERDLTLEGVDLVRSGSSLSALPSSELGNEIRPYVPSRYRLCYLGTRELVDPSRALDQLPTQVNDVLRGKERTDGCSEVTAEEARALELILIDKGWVGFVTPEWMNLYGDNIGSEVRFGMTVQGLLPHELGTSAVPDVVKQGTCSDEARWRLEVTDLGDMIKVRFEVHQSPAGDLWRIHFRPFSTFLVNEFFHGTSVASDSGVVVVQPRYPDRGEEGLKANVVDRQTGQVCKASASYG